MPTRSACPFRRRDPADSGSRRPPAARHPPGANPESAGLITRWGVGERNPGVSEPIPNAGATPVAGAAFPWLHDTRIHPGNAMLRLDWPSRVVFRAPDHSRPVSRGRFGGGSARNWLFYRTLIPSLRWRGCGVAKCGATLTMSLGPAGTRRGRKEQHTGQPWMNAHSC